MLDGESRPAAPCARIAHLASHKGRRVPESGEFVVRLPTVDAGDDAFLLDVEAYTYTEAPRDKVVRTALRSVGYRLPAATEDRALKRLIARDPAFRPAPQERGMVVTRVPATLTLRFDPAERGRRAAFGVFAWRLPGAHLRFDAPAPRAGERLAIGFGVRDRGWEGGPPVTFSVAVGGTAIWRRTLDPARVESDRGWQEVVLDLPRHESERLPLVLAADGEGAAGRAALPAWTRPALVPSTRAESSPPSILLLSFDTLRADHVGAYGWRRVTTPTLDRLAAHGVLFEQAVAQFPSTTASHMTMLTSLAPCVHAVIGPQSGALSAAIPTLAERLAARGYVTVAITEDGLISGALGFNRGFDSYRDLEPVGSESLGAFPRGIALARAWLERHGHEPFFLFLHTYQVHRPYKIPAHLHGLFPVDPAAGEAKRQEADYDAGLRYADELFDGFLGYLTSSGILARTLLVVTSDHGTEFGEHGGIGHATAVYEEQVRVPLLFHHPTLAAGGRRVRQQVALLDLAPTLLEIAGAGIPPTFAGRSLVPLLRGMPAGWDGDRAVFAEQLWGQRQTLLRRDGHAWIERRGAIELYDLRADPGEQQNLAPRAPERASDGARRIAEFRAGCQRESVALRGGSRSAPVLDPEREQMLRALGYLR